MALFGKPDTLSTLLKKIKGDEYRNTEELNNWLARIGADLDLKARQIVWMVGHHKREVRDFGKHRLEELKDSSIVDLLMKEMERKSPARRLEIAKLAMNLNPRKVFGHIGRMLQSQKLDSRLGALDLIAARPNLVDYIGYLKAGLKDPESRIRQNEKRTTGWTGTASVHHTYLIFHLIQYLSPHAHNHGRLTHRSLLQGLLLYQFIQPVSCFLPQPFFSGCYFQVVCSIRFRFAKDLQQFLGGSRKTVHGRFA